MELVFATHNPGKLSEALQILGDEFSLKTLTDVGISETIPEPFDTFEANALAKADYVYQKVQKNCFSEDSGIVVSALDGAPGVFSARYAGIASNDDRNNRKLITELQGKQDLRAWYSATICCILGGKIFYFTGKCEGEITLEAKGENGFGYDPHFIPVGYNQTFGELDKEIKNTISHRAKVFNQFTAFLKEYKNDVS